MSGQLYISLKRPVINRWMVMLLLVYGMIISLTLQTYITWQSVNVVLGLISLPVVSVIDARNKKSVRYAIAALLLAFLSCWLPVKTMLYGTIVLAGFFIVESFMGKTNLLPLLVVGLMSPVFQYLANVFSFPLRLQLTKWSGSIMNLMTMEITVKGNMIVYEGNEFSVDPACMGLNMIVTALLIQVILVAIYQKRNSVQLTWWKVGLLLGIVSLLNIVSNLIRIICLVKFNILPFTMMHELIGIICFMVYVVVPAAYITRFAARKCRQEIIPVDNESIQLSTRKLTIWHSFLLAITIIAAMLTTQYDKRDHDASASVLPVQGYKVQRIQADIIKLDNAQSLIYIKTIPGFYNADHNPMICWKGSGYNFQQVEEQSVGNMKIYTGVLQSGKEQLYTAWWYDNGKNRTIDQLNWRWDVLKGADNYSIVNVTAQDTKQLMNEVRNILKDNRLNQLLASAN